MIRERERERERERREITVNCTNYIDYYNHVTPTLNDRLCRSSHMSIIVKLMTMLIAGLSISLRRDCIHCDATREKPIQPIQANRIRLVFRSHRTQQYLSKDRKPGAAQPYQSPAMTSHSVTTCASYST